MQLRRPDVVNKATQLLDDYGIADLTMRRLAKELNVTAGALYWHFANKQELLGAVADKILAPTASPLPESDWQDRMLAIGAALRNALLSTTDGAELVAASFAAGRSAMVTEVLTRLAESAVTAGIESDHAELVARTLVHYVLGFTADEQSRIQWDAMGALPDEQSILAADPTARFEFGLKLLVIGVAHAEATSQRD